MLAVHPNNHHSTTVLDSRHEVFSAEMLDVKTKQLHLSVFCLDTLFQIQLNGFITLLQDISDVFRS